jgi:acyl-coenzyme A thioesterase PaaI-like protein
MSELQPQDPPETYDRANLARWCYACGELNPIGLHLRFRMQDDWAIASFTATQMHQGYPGYVHGGVVTSLLDEAMGWATYGRGIWAITARLELRFREVVPTEELLEVRARIVRDRGRTLDLVAELHDASGKLLARATGLLFRATAEQAERIRAAAMALGASKASEPS